MNQAPISRVAMRDSEARGQRREHQVCSESPEGRECVQVTQARGICGAACITAKQIDSLISGRLAGCFRGRADAHRAWCRHWRTVLRVAIVDREGAGGCWAAVKFGLPWGGKSYLAALHGLRVANQTRRNA